MINTEKIYTCKYDRVFKEIFAKEENKDILIKLLESILKVKIEKVEYLNLERNVDNVNIVRKHLDLFLKTDVGKIQVEVNATNKDYVKPRNMAYICDIYSHHTLKGETYNEETMMIQINFSYGIDIEEYVRKYRIQDNIGNRYVKNFVIYELNMDKYIDIWYNKDEKEINENKYLLMLNLELKDLENLSSKDKVVSKYMSELERVNENPEFREYMSAEEDNRKIQNSLRIQAIREGHEEGRKEGLEKNLIRNGVDISIIVDSTGLSEEEINSLK